MPKKSSAIVVKSFKGQWKDADTFVNWLADEIDANLSVRGAALEDNRLAWAYYEQARMRGGSAPWPDAADLPSPYAPEYTDAVHARLMQTVFVDPVWTVEGWGASAVRAPFVEEFHQRAAEDERLQDYADDWILHALLEGVGTLEISEAFEMRTESVRKRVALEIDALTGQPIMGEDHKPVLQRDPETGQPVEVQEEQAQPGMPPPQPQPSAEVEMDVQEPVRLGPEYDVIPYADFGVLPAHARNKSQIWGYWKRFYRRVPELQARAKAGTYDAEAVEGVGTDDEGASQASSTPTNAVVVAQDGMTAQKELFEVQLLADLDGKGERWYRVTLSKDRKQLLRLVHDDRTTRYIRYIPFPRGSRPGAMDRGYSLVSNKLITVLEEDTAVRNMTADRMAMVAGQPIMKRQGALWDEFEQPWGPKAVITVRDMDEIKAFQGVSDFSPSLFNWRQSIRADADRLIGQNDVSQGQISEENKTLGEVQLVAGYAEVRTNVLIRRMQEALEELFQARHTIWKRTLQSNPRLPPQRAMVIGRNAGGVDTTGLAQDQQITAQMLEGIFWGKPRGSVETADINRQRQDLIGLLQTLPAILQMNPAFGMILSTMPAGKSILEHLLKVFRFPDRQSILGSEAQNVFDVLQQQQQMQQDPRMQLLMAMGGGGAPGMGGSAMPAMSPEQGGAPPQQGPVM